MKNLHATTKHKLNSWYDSNTNLNRLWRRLSQERQIGCHWRAVVSKDLLSWCCCNILCSQQCLTSTERCQPQQCPEILSSSLLLQLLHLRIPYLLPKGRKDWSKLWFELIEGSNICILMSRGWIDFEIPWYLMKVWLLHLSPQHYLKFQACNIPSLS